MRQNRTVGSAGKALAECFEYMVQRKPLSMYFKYCEVAAFVKQAFQYGSAHVIEVHYDSGGEGNRTCKVEGDAGCCKS